MWRSDSRRSLASTYFQHRPRHCVSFAIKTFFISCTSGSPTLIDDFLIGGATKIAVSASQPLFSLPCTYAAAEHRSSSLSVKSKKVPGTRCSITTPQQQPRSQLDNAISSDCLVNVTMDVCSDTNKHQGCVRSVIHLISSSYLPC